MTIRFHRTFRYALALPALLCAPLVFAQPQPAPKPYEPTPFQAGKDVIWLATPQEVVNKMLDLGQVTAKDFVIDLGSGDGRTVITAARRGARGMGIEYNPDLVEYSNRTAKAAGVSDKVKFIAPPGIVSEAYIKTGGAMTEGTVLVADYFPDNPSDFNKAFVAAYRAKYGQPPDNWAAVGYTAALIMEKSIREGGANRAKLRDAMEQIKDMPTVLGNGKFTIGQNRAPNYGAAILMVKGGKFVVAD